MTMTELRTDQGLEVRVATTPDRRRTTSDPLHMPSHPRTSALRAFAGAALLAAAVAGGALTHGAPSALAPEISRLDEHLYSTSGDWAYATLVSSHRPTTVLFWTSSWSPAGPGITAGMPCSNVSLPAGGTTTRVILKTGNYARCA